MATKWRDIRHNHSPKLRRKIAHRVKDAARVMTLYQLREARNLTQVSLANVLQNQPGRRIEDGESATEHVRFDLRNFIQAMAEQLQVQSNLPRRRGRDPPVEALCQASGGGNDLVKIQTQSQRTPRTKAIREKTPSNVSLYVGIRGRKSGDCGKAILRSRRERRYC